MKRLQLLLVFVCLNAFITNIYAQESSNFTKAAYGNFTMDQFFNVKSKVLPDTYTRSDIKSKGAIFLSFTHPISGRISSGASIGANKITSDIVLNNQVVGILNRQLYTLAIESDFIYFKRPNFQLYAVAGYGYTFGNDEYFTDSGESDSGFIGFMAFQVSPIAIKVGNKLALFTELGFGYKGIANFGFMYGF